MAGSNSPYFSVTAKEAAPIKSHGNKEKAIKAAGKDGYIFDKILDLQMPISENEDGKLEIDYNPNSSFNFKKELYDKNILTSHY